MITLSLKKTKIFLKKIAILTALFQLPLLSNATHIAGGDLDIQWISGNNFKVTLKLFRDCANGGSQFDPSVDMAVYENGTNNYITSFTMNLTSSKSLILGDTCYAPPSSVCMEEGKYELAISLSNNTNGYYLAWERCCRSPLNLNLIEDQGMVFYAQIPNPGIKNSSPKFGNYPSNGYFCVNTLNAFDFSATDADGDDLIYSLITPLAGSSSPSDVTPFPGTKPYNPILWQSPYDLNNIVGGAPNMTINPNTGILTCTPTTQGAFTFAVLVEEYRGGVKIGEIIRDIQFFSLQCNKEVAAITQTPNNDDTALEGCIKASFNFALDKVQASDRVISFDIKGTAVNGVDYAYLENEIVVPAGQTNATIIIDAFADGIPEGKESIFLIYYPIPCNDLISDTVFLFIDDNQPISFNLTGTDLTCNGNFTGEIDAAVTGGNNPYVITVTDTTTKESDTYSSTNLPITGLAAGTYLVDVADKYGCSAEAEVVGALFDAGQTFLPDGNGQIFSAPLAISGISIPNITSPDQIQSICLNIEHSSLGDVEIRLVAPDGTVLTLKQRFNGTDGGHSDLGEPVAKNSTDGGNSSNVTPGVGYDYCFTATPTYGTMVAEHLNYTHTYVDAEGTTLTDNYLPSGSYASYQAFNALVGSPVNGTWIIEVEDHRPQSNGYIFNWSISFKADKPGNIITIDEPNEIVITGGVTSSSCNGADGAIDISATGDNGPFTYTWSNAATTEDISGLAAGSYTVTVEDVNNCADSAVYLVPNATGPGISAVITHESCVGSNNGAIDATFTGTITDIAWSNSAATEDISSLAPGDYTVTVTDISGCKNLQTYTINAATPITVSGATVNEKCGNKEGEINATIFGGIGGFTYLWSNGKTTEDIADLEQNTYTLMATDGNGCLEQKSFSIINEVGSCTPQCDLAINNESIINESCGQANGSIDLSISTSNSPSSVSWSNGMTGSSVSGLAEGAYTATIIDPLGCEIVKSYTIANDAGTLAINNSVITDDNCGTNTGAIDISVSGGTPGYSFTWSNATATEDISGIGQGAYSVTVTDGAGCKVSQTFSVLNQTGNMSLTTENVTDEICNNNNGSINIEISPSGTYTYLWSTGATTQDITNLSAGTYSCTITQSSTGCKLLTQVYTVNNSSGSLSVTVNDKDDEVCGNGTGEIDISVSGGASYTYDWSTGQVTQDIMGLSAGIYSCEITDNNGCKVNTGDIQIFDLQGTLEVTPFITDEVCDNNLGAVDIYITGGTSAYNILWSNSATTEDISNLSEGSYTYTVTDQAGCTVISSVYVANNVSGTLALSDQVVTDEVCGNAGGQIDITVSGGTGSYNYLWSNSAVTEDITGLPAGTYTVAITDGNNCQLISTATVNNAPGTLANTEVITHPACGKNTGNIDLTVTGGSGSYTYTWSSGQLTQDITSLAPGTYTYTISDGTGCIINKSATLIDQPAPVGSIKDKLDEICGSVSTLGYIDLDVMGGTPGFTYNWSSGETTQDIFNLYANTYTCIITDANGCKDTVSTTIEYKASFTANGVVVDATCANCSNGNINITLNQNNFGQFSFYWSNGEISEDIFGLLPGTYIVTVVDNNSGCQEDFTFVVSYPNSVSIKENSTSDVFIIYPNPSHGLFTLDYEIWKGKDFEIDIFDVSGKKIIERHVGGSKGKELLDLQNLDPGIYFIHIRQNGTLQVKKIVVLK